MKGSRKKFGDPSAAAGQTHTWRRNSLRGVRNRDQVCAGGSNHHILYLASKLWTRGGRLTVVAKWKFSNGNNRWILAATVDPEQIHLGGGELGPVLHVPVHLVQPDSSVPYYGNDVWAVCVDVLAPGDTSWPLFSSGFQPFEPSHYGVSTRLSWEYLGVISQAPIVNSNVLLALRVSLLARPDAFQRATLPGEVVQVAVPASIWYERLLPEVGYPHTQMVPLDLTLPGKLANSTPEASAVWSRATEQIRAAVTKAAHGGDPGDVLSDVRLAVEGAMTVWALVWGCDKGDMTFGEALGFVEAAGGCRVSSKPTGGSDARRIWSRALALWTLYSLASDGHHIGRRNVATKADAEAVATMAVGLLRQFPTFLTSFPTPPPPSDRAPHDA